MKPGKVSCQWLSMWGLAQLSLCYPPTLAQAGLKLLGTKDKRQGKPGFGCPRPQGRGRAALSLVAEKVTRNTGRGRGARGGRRAADETGSDPSRARHPLLQQV